jgi:UDP-N-acetylmuramoyl-tripeptide--D-alanyl-D-alanine ligase
MELYNIFKQHSVICTDSRNCPAGSMFFALRGDNFNANTFALTALKNGCAFAVVDEVEYAVDERFILVDNVLKTLQELASYHRKQMKATVIGITGTNGKTTTKELLASVLKEKYDILFTQGNLNNHIGVPLTLLQLQPEHKIAIIEMGANHQGEIKALCEIAQPDYGLITNVGKAHLEGFGSFEGVKKAKAELYEYIAQHGKNIFIDKNNSNLIGMAQHAGFDLRKVQNYCVNADLCDGYVKGKITASSPYLQMECMIDKFDSFPINTQLVGTYNAENVLAAVLVGDYFGISMDEIRHGIETYRPQNNRSQLTQSEHNILLIDAYNANPSSMRAAIQNFEKADSENKTLILGDMFELGDQSFVEHQQIVDMIEAGHFDSVFLVGKYFSQVNHSYASFETTDELIQFLKNNPIHDRFILVKGSRGMKLENILSVL